MKVNSVRMPAWRQSARRAGWLSIQEAKALNQEPKPAPSRDHATDCADETNEPRSHG